MAIAMHRSFFPLLLVTIAFGQDPADLFEKAPPAVDRALRERIAGFYQAHVDGKFRLADQYVAEETKDFYYEANKPRYLGFSVEKIVYSDNFTRAKAVVLCEQVIAMPGFADKPHKFPTPSSWRLEGGQWYWWVDQSKGRETPFGVLKPGTVGTRAGTAALPTAMPDLATVQSSIAADKKAVRLFPGTEETVTIRNGALGAVQLVLGTYSAAGIEIRLDRTEIKSNETAKLIFRSTLKKPAGLSMEIQVVAQPFNVLLPVQVAF